MHNLNKSLIFCELLYFNMHRYLFLGETNAEMSHDTTAEGEVEG